MSPSPYLNENVIKVREVLAEYKSDGWERAWKSNLTPWDHGRVQPPLEELYTSGDRDVPFPRSGRALVPGCGTGYDAVCIAEQLPGLEVTGMDISQTAVAAATAHLNGLPSPPPNLSFESGDFFELEDASSRYDLVSDYTFFQALPPALRPAWGAKMRSILNPAGLLVVLAFPTDAPHDSGPPYGIPQDAHAAVLGDGWTKLVDRVPLNSAGVHVGRDRLIVFQKL